MQARPWSLPILGLLMLACDSEPDELGEKRHHVIAGDNFAEGGCTFPGMPNELFFDVRASYEEYACTDWEESRSYFDDDDCVQYGWVGRAAEVRYRVESVTCKTDNCVAHVDGGGHVVATGNAPGDVWADILVSLPERDAKPAIVRGHFWVLASVDEGCGSAEQHRH